MLSSDCKVSRRAHRAIMYPARRLLNDCRPAIRCSERFLDEVMTILGIGVDLVRVPRIAQLLRRRGADKFASKILSKSEYTQWKSSFAAPADLDDPRCVQFLAVRFVCLFALFRYTN